MGVEFADTCMPLFWQMRVKSVLVRAVYGSYFTLLLVCGDELLEA